MVKVLIGNFLSAGHEAIAFLSRTDGAGTLTVLPVDANGTPGAGDALELRLDQDPSCDEALVGDVDGDGVDEIVLVGDAAGCGEPTRLQRTILRVFGGVAAPPQTSLIVEGPVLLTGALLANLDKDRSHTADLIVGTSAGLCVVYGPLLEPDADSCITDLSARAGSSLFRVQVDATPAWEVLLDSAAITGLVVTSFHDRKMEARSLNPLVDGTLVGAADLNADGVTDLIVQHGGNLAVWLALPRVPMR